MDRVLLEGSIIDANNFHLIRDFYTPEEFTVARFEMCENMTSFGKLGKGKCEKKGGKEEPT